jgi:hypothetical protein
MFSLCSTLRSPKVCAWLIDKGIGFLVGNAVKFQPWYPHTLRHACADPEANHEVVDYPNNNH